MAPLGNPSSAPQGGQASPLIRALNPNGINPGMGPHNPAWPPAGFGGGNFAAHVRDILPGNDFAAHVQGMLPGHSRMDAAQLRGIGHPEQAARLWESRHPWAMEHGHVPPWVERNLFDFDGGQHAGMFAPSQPGPQDIIAAAAGSNPSAPQEPSGGAVPNNPLTRTASAFNSLRGGQHLQALLAALGGNHAHSGMVPY